MENTSVVDGLVNIIEETEKQIEELGRQNVGWRKELRKCYSWTQDTTVKGKLELEKFIQKELDKAREEGKRETLLEMQREFSEYGVPDDVRYTHPLFYINNIIEEKLSKLKNNK